MAAKRNLKCIILIILNLSKSCGHAENTICRFITVSSAAGGLGIPSRIHPSVGDRFDSCSRKRYPSYARFLGNDLGADSSRRLCSLWVIHMLLF